MLWLVLPLAANAQTTPPAKDAVASRDALFGDAPAEPADAKISGFYEFTPAYTYGDPKHWSRAVNRLAVDARGGFGERRQVEARRAGRRRPDLHGVELLPAGREGEPARHRDLARELPRLRRRRVGLPRRRAEHRLGRRRGPLLRRRGLGAGPARLPAAELRRDPHSAMGGAGGVLDRRLARRTGLGADADLRQHRQAGVRLLPGTAAFAHARERRRRVPEPGPAVELACPTRPTGSARTRSPAAGTSPASTTAATAARRRSTAS